MSDYLAVLPQRVKTQNPQQQTLNPLIAGPFFYVNIIVFARISLFQYTIIPLLYNALCHSLLQGKWFARHSNFVTLES